MEAQKRRKISPPSACLRAHVTRLRSLFPHKILARALEQRGLNAAQASRQAGVSPPAVRFAVRGEKVPRAQTLTRLLESLGIDKTPFVAVIEAQEKVVVVCPHCGRARPLSKSNLRSEGPRAKGREEFRRRADGSYERACRACSASRKGRATLYRTRERRLERKLGAVKASVLIEEAKAGEPAAEEKIRNYLAPPLLPQTIARFKNYIRRPKPKKHRQAIGFSHLVMRAATGRHTRPFFLCPLCELVTHTYQWHKRCWYTWMGWHQRIVGSYPRPDARPPALQPRTRGLKPETNLMRNYNWLIAIRGRAKSLQEVVRDHGPGVSAKSSVISAVQAFLRLLPGSWDLVFSESPIVRRANVHRQQLVPLPLEMQRVVGIGGRDPLIRRLLEFGMAEPDVARLTGVDLPRVKGMRVSLGSPLNASAQRGRRPAGRGNSA